MAQGDRSHIRLAQNKEATESAEFNALLRECYDKPWWRAIIHAVTQRRNNFMTVLVNGQEDQRTEDKLRGQINECNFFITLDEIAQSENEKKG